MQTTLEIVQISKASHAARWAGRILSAVPVLFLIFDGAIKMANLQPVIDSSVQLGLPISLAPSLGMLLLACIGALVWGCLLLRNSQLRARVLRR